MGKNSGNGNGVLGTFEQFSEAESFELSVKDLRKESKVMSSVEFVPVSLLF